MNQASAVPIETPAPRPAPRIPAAAVRVAMGDPVVIAQAPPEVTEWGRYRMPKLFPMPDGAIGLTYQMGRDHYCDQGVDSPWFASRDGGRSWQAAALPHPAIRGLSPMLNQVHDGEFLCVPNGTGLELDPARLPAPVGSFGGYAGFSLRRLRDCPPDVAGWFAKRRAVRWSPRTGAWSEEGLAWDIDGQLLWAYHDTPQGIPGHWSQKPLFERPMVRHGDELLYADYWTQREHAAGGIPHGWECSLMASSDNGRSWRRRSLMAQVAAGDNTGEPALALNRRGELVGVLRRDFGTAHPMYLVHSRDGGRSWSEPQTLFEHGVFPWLVQLENGVLALVFGRPGVWMSFSLDGGHAWSEPHPVIDDPSRGYSSCGNTSILAIGPDRLLVAYNHVRHPDAHGRPCKTILVRSVTVAAA